MRVLFRKASLPARPAKLRSGPARPCQIVYCKREPRACRDPKWIRLSTCPSWLFGPRRSSSCSDSPSTTSRAKRPRPRRSRKQESGSAFWQLPSTLSRAAGEMRPARLTVRLSSLVCSPSSCSSGLRTKFRDVWEEFPLSEADLDSPALVGRSSTLRRRWCAPFVCLLRNRWI